MIGIAILLALQAPGAGALYQAGNGEPYPGWQTFSGPAGGVSPDSDETETAVLRRGDDYVVATLRPVSRAGVEPAIWRIEAVLRARRNAGEIAVTGLDCPLLDREPAVAFFSRATNSVRGIFVLPRGIVEQRWTVRSELECHEAGD